MTTERKQTKQEVISVKWLVMWRNGQKKKQPQIKPTVAKIEKQEVIKSAYY